MVRGPAGYCGAIWLSAGAMAPLKYDGQMARFDITVPYFKEKPEGNAEEFYFRWFKTVEKCNYPTFQEFGEFLLKWCKNFVFQLELGGEGNYYHWQCRVDMIGKKTCHAMMKTVIPAFPAGSTFSVTSKGVHEKKSFNYVMKEDTKVEGPWKKDNIRVRPPMTRQLAQFIANVETDGFRPWQQNVLDICELEEDRFIHFIYDEHGNCGKSIMVEYLEFHDKALEVFAFNDMSDFMGFCHSMPVQKCYLVDMPRGMHKDKLTGFYTGIESLKNGLTFDKRYEGRKRRFDRPQVILYSNRYPDFNLLSLDRWVVFEMQRDFSLKKLTEEEMLRHRREQQEAEEAAKGRRKRVAPPKVEPPKVVPVDVIHYNNAAQQRLVFDPIDLDDPEEEYLEGTGPV